MSDSTETAGDAPHAGLDTVPEIAAINSAKLGSGPEVGHLELPSPIITKRTRRVSLTERAMEGPLSQGKIKYFCRQRGHGFISPDGGGDDIFVHISDIDGEFVPHAGDTVAFKVCTIPPKCDKFQAIHVTIKNLAPGVHERWDQPPVTHHHPHPSPNIKFPEDHKP